MLTGEIRNQVDRIWDAFWSGGISNPLSVIEQIAYLLFIKRLDDLQTLEENKSQALGIPMERRIFPKGRDEKGCLFEDMRWSRFKHFEPREMMEVVDEHVYPFLRGLGSEGSVYARHMPRAYATSRRTAPASSESSGGFQSRCRRRRTPTNTGSSTWSRVGGWSVSTTSTERATTFTGATRSPPLPLSMSIG